MFQDEHQKAKAEEFRKRRERFLNCAKKMEGKVLEKFLELVKLGELSDSARREIHAERAKNS